MRPIGIRRAPLPPQPPPPPPSIIGSEEAAAASIQGRAGPRIRADSRTVKIERGGDSDNNCGGEEEEEEEEEEEFEAFEALEAVAFAFLIFAVERSEGLFRWLSLK